MELTNSIPNAQPPRFDYEWLDEDTLKVTYKSKRNLIGLYAGLARGVGLYFNDPLTVTPLSDSQVSIRFA